MITFDDGYQSVYDEAFPVLQRYDMSATVFLTVAEKGTAQPGRLPSLNGRSMLTWHEIREMQRWGIAFGAHTLAHPDLTCLPFHRVEAETCDSKAITEDALNAPIDCFAYPYALERVDAYYLHTDPLFDVMLTRLFPWYIGARSIPRRIRLAFQHSSEGW